MESSKDDILYVNRDHIVAAIELIQIAREAGELPEDLGELVLVILSAIVSIAAASRPDSLSIYDAYNIIVEKISRLLSRSPVVYVGDKQLQ